MRYRFFLLAGGLALAGPGGPVLAAGAGDIVVNEIAWGGTAEAATKEWMELRNTGAVPVDLAGWTLNAADGAPMIALAGMIPGGGFFLLERTSDATVPGLEADLVYTGALENGGEVLELRDASGTLIDSVDAGVGWPAGNNDSKATMERTDAGWQTATAVYDFGFGTPKAPNTGAGAPGATPQFLNQVSQAPGAINVYFNKSARTDFALPGNAANHQINLEQRLIARLSGAQSAIDMTIFELNLPDIVDALIERAAAGVLVRVIADAKKPDPGDLPRVERFELMRLFLERMARGADDISGTADDVLLFSDSPLFAVEDSAKRLDFGLPETPEGLIQVTLGVGNGTAGGYLLADAELEAAPDSYYAAGVQSHNKFAVIDGTWVWTGSWNFTVTGLYGSEANRLAGILDGNQQHAVEVNSPELADAFTLEFNEMWGSSGPAPAPAQSNFHGRKSDNTPHLFTVGGRPLEAWFSPGDDAVGRVVAHVAAGADFSAFFTIFAWSTQALVDTLKLKWEGSLNDLEGTPTGFEVAGVFDSDFWNQWWSASINMTGRTASQTSVDNPNIRWNNPAPVFPDAESAKLHAKSMIIDACTLSSPSVIVGSTNWSNNGNAINDENLLIIEDALIANQFLQEFYARYEAAGGAVPDPQSFVCDG